MENEAAADDGSRCWLGCDLLLKGRCVFVDANTVLQLQFFEAGFTEVLCAEALAGRYGGLFDESVSECRGQGVAVDVLTSSATEEQGTEKNDGPAIARSKRESLSGKRRLWKLALVSATTFLPS